MLLKELRAEAEKNIKKQTPLQQLEQILHNVPDPHRVFVTFTVHKKFGTNPRSQFATPLGLYSYPLQYVVQQKMNVPYAAKSPHIWVFEAPSFWDLQGPYDGVVHQRLLSVLQELDVDPDFTLEAAKSNIDVYKGIKNTLQHLGYTHKSILADKEKNPNLLLRKIFMRAGVNGVADFGSGVIYKTEPHQMVYFDVTKLNIISYIPNQINVKFEKPTMQTAPISFEEYYDKVVVGNRARDVNQEQSIIFNTEPTEYELRKFITRSIMQRRGRLQFLEKYIAKYADVSLMYARDLLQKRFLRGEAVIKNDRYISQTYGSIFPEFKYGAR